MAEGARKHLVEREKKRTRVVDAVALGTNALFIPYELANNHLLYPEIVLTSYLAMQAILLGGNSWANKQIFDDMLLADLRWSLTGGGWQPEKYFATKALLHVTPIIRYRK